MNINFENIVKQIQNTPEMMKTMQKELSKSIITGESGGGMVKIKMNGNGNAIKIEIEKSLFEEKKK